MAGSATTTRERRRRETADRISACAQALTEARGLDGFTMDDLAAAADVSRRTLFNYFPGKTDAVLGAVPELPADLEAAFAAGGPSGELIEDLGVLARRIIDDQDLDREMLRRGRRLLTSEPRLLLATHERFESLISDFAVLLETREGTAIDPRRARLVVRLLVTLFDVALPGFLEDPLERPLSDHYEEALRDARALLA
jgi:AcrR family transcriptional regulator